MNDRTGTLANIICLWTAAEALQVATMLRAAGQGAAAGVWFEAADLFERIIDTEENAS